MMHALDHKNFLINELSYEVATELSAEEEDKTDTSEPPVTLL